MSIDWNQKLAWVLRDPVDASFDLLQVSSHRAAWSASADTAALPEVGPRAQWLTSGADRVPFPSTGPSSKVELDWAAEPEVTHPLAAVRTRLEGVDLAAARKAVGSLAYEAAKRFEGDARRTQLWMWRYLPDRLSADDSSGSGALHQVPADPRLPNLSIWSRMAVDGALASAAPSPAFLAFRLGPSEAFLYQAAHVVDLWSSAGLLANLMWQAMLPIVEELGPDAILTPSLRYHPVVDAWLAEQGVQAAAKDKALGTEHAPTLPCDFVALVPADRAAEIGRACEQRLRDAWVQLAGAVRAHVAKAGWCSDKDAVWGGIWERQVAAAWNPTWVAVAWGDDSTGAGGLAPKHEVTALEKWARLQEDAAGLEDAWPGVYYGLWQGAAQAAAVCRQRAAALTVVREPNGRCTVCGDREALHGKIDFGVDGGFSAVHRFWDAITAAGAPAHDHVATGEMLCAVCTVRRMAGELPAKAAPLVVPKAVHESVDQAKQAGLLALVLMVPDNHGALVRGGKELKQGATLADCVHGAVGKHLARARSHLREVIDAIPPLGPARNASVGDAFRNFTVGSAPALLAEHGAVPLLLNDEAVVAVAPAARSLELARAMRARFRSPMVELELPRGGKRLALHPGPTAPASTVVALARPGERLGVVLRDCRALLDQVARDGLGGDALVMMLRTRLGDDRLYAAHWDDLGKSLDALVGLLPEARDRARLAAELRGLEPAIGNPDLDKPAPQARPLLVRAQLASSSLLGKLQGEDAEEALAQAVCSVVDQGVALSGDADRSRALDGLHIAIHLAGGTR